MTPSSSFGRWSRTDLPLELRARKDFVVEVDAMPGKYVCSASFKGQAKAGAVMETVSGGQPLRKLFSKSQRAFFADHAPERGRARRSVVLGPVIGLQAEGPPGGLDRKLAVELWLYPDGSRIVELSTKCAPGDWLETTTQSRDYLLGPRLEPVGRAGNEDARRAGVLLRPARLSRRARDDPVKPREESDAARRSADPGPAARRPDHLRREGPRHVVPADRAAAAAGGCAERADRPARRRRASAPSSAFGGPCATPTRSGWPRTG